MTQVVTLRELSSCVGVDIDHLKRMIRIGSLPEASKQANPAGDVWAVPVEALPQLADRHGWTVDTIDLTSGNLTTDNLAADNLAADDLAADNLTTGQDLVVRPDQPIESPDFARSDEEVTVAEIVDGALLNRLLGAHEERAEAEARTRESQRAMTTMAAGQKRMVRELAEERYERQRVNDRYRDERTARLITDAKLAELRAHLDHERASTERERRARTEADQRIVDSERQAAAALASMGWLGRRRLKRRLENPELDRR